MSYSLIVVDMQLSFFASHNKRTQRACIREISKAIRDKATIVFVEYKDHGETLSILTEVVRKANYRRVVHLVKSDDDGSGDLIELLRKKHLPILNLRVCGVNTGYCVHDTVKGLSLKLPNSTIRVIADACNCSSKHGHERGLIAIRYYPNTELLRASGLA